MECTSNGKKREEDRKNKWESRGIRETNEKDKNLKECDVKKKKGKRNVWDILKSKIPPLNLV